MGPHIYAGDAVEQIGKAHDAGVVGGQGDQLGIVGEDGHQLLRQEKHHRREERGDGARRITAQTDDAVDGVGVSLAPELADEHRGAALQAEDDQLDDKHRRVGHQYGGQRGLAQGTHHEGVDEAQKGGGQILQQNGQAQQYHVSVKAAAAFQVRKQTVTSLRSWF